MVICKPKIRKIASVGDWIVGTGSANSPIGNIGGKVVYAMRVSQTMTMKQHDKFTQQALPEKFQIGEIPTSADVWGIPSMTFDFSSQPPAIRKSVHNEDNRERDLKGEHALLSDHFFYFGDKPVDLPDDLRPMINQARGHRSRSNDPYFERFFEWIHSLAIHLISFWANPNLIYFQMILSKIPAQKGAAPRLTKTRNYQITVEQPPATAANSEKWVTRTIFRL